MGADVGWDSEDCCSCNDGNGEGEDWWKTHFVGRLHGVDCVGNDRLFLIL